MASSKAIPRMALRTSISIILIYVLLISSGAIDSLHKVDKRWLTTHRDKIWNMTSTTALRTLQDQVSLTTSNLHQLPDDQIPDEHQDNATPFKTSSSKWKQISYTDPSSAAKHFHRTNNDIIEEPSLLILTMTKDISSWATNTDSTPRNFISFLSMLSQTNLDPSTISLTILTSSRTEYSSYISLTASSSFAHLHFIHHPGYQHLHSSTSSRGSRHDDDIQHARRAEMAKLRNYATITSLQQEQIVLWFDADIVDLSPGLIPEMLDRMKHPKVGVLTVRSQFGDNDDSDYDFNAWRGKRTKPNDEERERLRFDKGSWVANRGEGGKQMMDLVKEYEESVKGAVDEKGVFDPSRAKFEKEASENGEEEDEDERDEIPGLARLDAVGATVLMMKAALIRQGLVYSVGYLVGTDWRDEGWDGIESEGLCLQARTMGSNCYGMVERKWWSRHSLG